MCGNFSREKDTTCKTFYQMVWMDHRHEEEKGIQNAIGRSATACTTLFFWERVCKTTHSSPISCLGARKVSRVMAQFKMISESLLLLAMTYVVQILPNCYFSNT
ncbi:hypothetical protein TELCIR_01871 [Teladorsagia circumcincta]|uniref:Uncharacterized protein n=1 Tax=Teladorsagia circumcincta TaxID=45464 RepID=A0A2G9V0Z0_TELCI|nr:hypothetical protein TELCIR_01871 [Teladorsagia circumcincta]